MHAEWRRKVSLFGRYFWIFIQSKKFYTFYEIYKIPCQDACTIFIKMHHLNGSKTIASEENCHPTPKLTLTQVLTLTGGLFSSRAVVWLTPKPKTNPNLDPNPNPNQGAIFHGGNCPDTHLNK